MLNRVLSPRGFTYATKNDIVVIKRKEQKKRVLEGKVVDDMGDEVSGVTILIVDKDQNVGTMTDPNGNFSLDLPTDNTIVRISFVGMKTLEINTAKLNLEKKQTFQLVPDAKLLDEIVVTGYQEIDRRKLASSILSIKGSDLMGGEYMSVDKMLQGRLPGVAVMNMSSTPGAAPKIRIRGSSSITGNREPVWVVDGIILEEAC